MKNMLVVSMKKMLVVFFNVVWYIYLQHTVILADGKNAIKSRNIVGSGNENPLLFQGVGYEFNSISLTFSKIF